MAIPPPHGELRAFVVGNLGDMSWPGGDETQLSQLGTEWRAAATDLNTTVETSRRIGKNITALWRDGAGDLFLDTLNSHNTNVAPRTHSDMTALAGCAC